MKSSKLSQHTQRTAWLSAEQKTSIFARFPRGFFNGTPLAIGPSAINRGLATKVGCEANASNHRSNDMNSRLFWAFLWVIGLPLPIVLILYMLFGGHT
jgi:hypothetical protein